MIFAALGAIHGNLPALDAALDAVDAQGIEIIVCTGSAIGLYPWPNEVVERLRERRVVTVQGEDDRWVVRSLRQRSLLRRKCAPARAAALEWTFDRLRSDLLEELATWPRRRDFVLDGLRVCVCHGAPSGARRDASDSLDVMRRERETAAADIVVGGHGDAWLCRLLEDTLFVHPGPVGRLGPAGYAMVDTEREPWSAEFIEAPYDWDAVRARLDECGLPVPE